MKLPYLPKSYQHSDLVGRLIEPDFRIDEYQRRKIAARFGVSPDTARTVAALAGFSDGGRQ